MLLLRMWQKNSLAGSAMARTLLKMSHLPKNRRLLLLAGVVLLILLAHLLHMEMIMDGSGLRTPGCNLLVSGEFFHPIQHVSFYLSLLLLRSSCINFTMWSKRLISAVWMTSQSLLSNLQIYLFFDGVIYISILFPLQHPWLKQTKKQLKKITFYGD